MVDAFHKNDMTEATVLGQAFLAADLKPSAYQLLGVKVMLGLADETTGSTVFESREDQQERKRLTEERSSITKRYQELIVIYQDADARINELTVNRTRPVKQGSSPHLECLRCAQIMDETKAALDTLKAPIEKNKTAMAELSKKADVNMKPQTLELLDMLLAAQEMEAAFAIANTYIRKIGNDFDVAKKQQEVVRLYEISEKATKVVALLQADVDSLTQKKNYWEAKAKSDHFLTRVKELNSDPDLLRMIQAKIQVTMGPVQARIKEGDRTGALIKAQADTDFSNAYKTFEMFCAEYPDSPDRLELELFIASAKTRSVDQIIARIVLDFDDLQGRFDPERLSTLVSRSTVEFQKESAFLSSKEDTRVTAGAALVEVGASPADARLVQARLEGLSSALVLLEKLGAPEDRMIQITQIRKTVAVLAHLIGQKR